MGSDPPPIEQRASIAFWPSLLEADFRITTEPHVAPSTVHLVSQRPGFPSAGAHNEHEAVATPMHSRFRGFDTELGQVAHNLIFSV